MMKKVSERELKQAATVLWEEWKTFLETVEPHDPSPEFDARMHRLIAQKQQEIKLREKEKKRRIRHRVAVAAVLVLAILLGWLLIDQTAYAKVSKWFKSIVKSAIKIEFSGDISEVQEPLSKYHLLWIPDGAETIFEETDDLAKDYTIVLSYDGEVKIHYHYGYMNDGTSIVYFDSFGEERIYKQLQIKGIVIDCYLSSSHVENDYFWVDEEEGLFFSMTSFFSDEINIKILEGIVDQ